MATVIGKISSTKLEQSWYNDAYVDQLTADLRARIQNLTDLGSKTVPASVATKAVLPTNKSGFTVAPTVNDFTWVRADETNGGDAAIYQITGINEETGALAWALFHVFEKVDLSNKIDKLGSSHGDEIPVITAGGGLTSSGVTIDALKDDIWGDLVFEPIT